MKKDVFISHASEDKADFVKPLAEILKEFGVSAWYDEYELKVGSSLSRSIDKGISCSKYGIIVLSPAFFNKNWTEYELKSLNSFEVENGDVLLPIWKDVDFKVVRNFSPYLADKFALKSNQTIEEIAIKIIEVVRPDIFSEIHLKLLTEKAILEGKVYKTNDYSLFRKAPKRHLKLSANLISRIRLIRSSLWLGYPNSMEYWVDGFQRDTHVEKEVRFWEHLSSCFLELTMQHNASKYYKRNDHGELGKDLFFLVSGILQSNEIQPILKERFTKGFIQKAVKVCHSSLPLDDSKSLISQLQGPFMKDVTEPSNDTHRRYWYEVHTFMTTFDKSEESSSHTEIFRGDDLLKVRARAISYYNKQLDSLSDRGEYNGKPFASPQEFVHGKNSAFSVFFYFASGDECEPDYSLLSDDDGSKEFQLTELAFEVMTLMKFGYSLSEIPLLLFNGITADELNEEIQELLSSQF